MFTEQSHPYTYSPHSKQLRIDRKMSHRQAVCSLSGHIIPGGLEVQEDRLRFEIPLQSSEIKQPSAEVLSWVSESPQMGLQTEMGLQGDTCILTLTRR